MVQSSPAVDRKPSAGAAVDAPTSVRTGAGRVDIAVIGMSGRFPGADDLDQLWANLQRGVVATGPVPAGRWPEGESSQQARCGFVNDIDRFDARFFRISAREAEIMDPQQRLFLEECWKAFEDAGLSDRDLDGARCGVFVGCKAADYILRVMNRNTATQADGHLFGGNDISMLPARVSYFLNLRGPSVPVNTACSSSLVALHLACQSLRNGDCRIAIAGGVEFMTHSGLFDSMRASGAVADDGICRTFDESANGMALAEAVCAVVLKPLEAALADGDRIHGIVRAIGVNQDGRSSGINAPNGSAQTDLELQVWERAGISPEDIGYIEAHGTGTPLGDPIEFNALSDAFRKSTQRTAICPIGSVKAFIGHTLSAAGLSGLIRIMLSLRHGSIPSMPNFRAPGPYLRLAESPFVVNTRSLEWPRRDDKPRLAAISSFGFSGTNVHAIIEEAPAIEAPWAANPGPELFLLSAHTEMALAAKRLAVRAWLAENSGCSLRDLAYTLHRGRSHFHIRQAFVASDTTELDALLADPGRRGSYRAPEGEPLAIQARIARLLKKQDADPTLRRGAIVALAALYEQGFVPAWRDLYETGVQRILSIPFYPFERQQYWVELDVSEPPTPQSEKALLAVPVWTPASLGETRPAGPVLLVGFENAPAMQAGTAIARSVDSLRSEDLASTVVLRAESLRDGALDLLALTRLAAERSHRILVCSTDEAVASGLAAMSRVLSLEFPKSTFSCLFAPARGFAAAVSAELGQPVPPQTLVKYEDGVRWLQEFQIASPPSAPAGAPLLPHGAVCLITGGAGGLGRIFALHLARTRAARLVLCGRSEESDGIRVLLAAVQESGGEAIYLRCDAGSRPEVNKLVTRALERFGRIDAVFHAAGVHRDAFAINKTVSQLDEELLSKAASAIHLRDALTAHSPLFVLFSSLSALRGAAGQAGYACANGYVDALAASLDRGISIAWPYWANGGMRIAENDWKLIAESTGLEPLPDDAGLRQFESILASGIRRSAVLYGEPGKMRTLLNLAPGRQSEPSRPGTGAADPSRRASVLAAAASLVTEIFSSVSRFPVSSIDPASTFEEYGLDSVMVKEFNARLQERLPGLPRTLLFEVRTLNDLAHWLADNHAGAFDPPEIVQPVPVATASRPSVTNADDAWISTGDIAIIGVHGRYPDAPDLQTFWENLVAGRDSVTEIPLERWDYRDHFDPDPERAKEGRSYCRFGAFLKAATCFDERFFHISPREASIMDPQERIFLETVWHTLENAGYTRARLRQAAPDAEGQISIGVFAGVTTNTYQLFGPEEWGKGNPVMPVSAPWSIANRVSYWFGFTGPSMPVDTACSSSLVAVHLACESIRRGECKMAIAGGVNLYLHPSKYVGMSQVRMLSPTGRCRAFGAGADGFVPGEGVGAVLLRPLRDAIESGDNILAVIRGSAVNHGGRTNSYTAPNPVSHAALISRAIEAARIDPATITCIEAHGTGTALGDPVEVRGLSLAFGRYTSRLQYCALSSLKSNIGHLEAAAGIGGLTKVLLQFRHRRLVPTLHSEPANADIDFAATPFVLQRSASDWNTNGVARRAGISSFGAGGANAHVILEEYVPPQTSGAETGWPELIVLSAQTPEALRTMASDLLRFLEKEEPGLASIAFTLQNGREPMEHRFAAVVADHESLRRALREYRDGSGVASGNWFAGVASAQNRSLDLLLEGEEGAAYLRTLREQRRLDKLAMLWTAGVDVDWAAMSHVPHPGLVSLPGYPFERRQHWYCKRPEVLPASSPGDIRVRQTDFFVRDHVIAGQHVVPGIALVELARAAAAASRPVSALTHIVFAQRLAVSEPGCEIRYAEHDGAFTLCSPGGTCHLQGRIGALRDAPAKVAIEAVKARSRSRLTAAECYPAEQQGARRAPVVIGPALQSIRELWRGDGEVLARLEIPASIAETVPEYALHPSLMDGALQSIVAMQQDLSGAADKLYFPFAIDGVFQYQPLGNSLYAHVVPAGETRSGETILTRKFDILLAREDGSISVAIRGFTTRIVNRETESAAVSTGLTCWKVGWIESSLATAASASVRLRTLNAPQEISAALVLAGADLNGGDDDSFVWCVGAEEDAYATIYEVLARPPRRLLCVIRSESPAGEALEGFIRSARLERFPTAIQLLCLPELSTAEAAEAILAELRRAPEDALVRREPGRRLVRGLEPAVLPGNAAVPLRNGGVYLITGGAGRLGTLIARDLRERWNATVILAGRSLRTAPENFIYHQCDFGDERQTANLVSSIRERYGRIDGVIHCAGVLRESFLKDLARKQDWRSELKQVLAGKVRGAVNLDAATAADSLDFLALFSSASGVLGGAGQSAYAYASAYLDSFARWRTRTRAGVTVSLDWGPWKDGSIGAVDSRVAEWLEQNLGLRPLETRSGLDAFYRALASGESQWLMLAGDRAGLSRGITTTLAKSAPASDRTEAAPLTGHGLQAELAAMAAQILQMDSAELAPERNLSEFGFESVSLIEFTNAVNRRYGLELIPTVFFEHPTLASLSDHLAETYPQTRSAPAPVQTEPPAAIREPATQEQSVIPAPAIIATSSDPVAIVGMSGSLPQSEDLEEFWTHLISGTELITEIPRDRWRWEDYYGDPKLDPNKTDSKWGGFMKEVDKFDPLFFGISPREAALMDPQHRLMLQHTWWAIENAGHKPSDLAGTRTAVFIGVASSDYATLIRERLTHMEAHGPLGNALCILTNRISYLLDLRGPSEPVDTGCSSSAIAIHRAVKAIENDGCEMAIAGGVNVILNPLMNVFFSQAGVMSKDHRCRAFDKNATGTIRGEGAGAFLLKPLSRAIADGNPIWGILRSTGENHGGKSSSLTAPNPAAQADLIASVYEAANVDPSTVGYIETHGTGTTLGDSVEISGLKTAFAKLYRNFELLSPAHSQIGIASVKTNVGHLEPAAGMVAVCKALLALRHSLLPANRHFDTVNPWLGLDSSPFYVLSKTTPWPVPIDRVGRKLPRRCGVSSFGMGGANAHLLIEEYRDSRPRVKTDLPQIFVFSAKTEERLVAGLRTFHRWLERDAADATADEVAWTLQTGREAFRERLSIVAPDLTELREELERVLAGRPQHSVRGTQQRVTPAAPESRRPLDIAAAWVQGAPADWAALHPVRPRRVSCPGYQFARIRCWIGEDGSTDSAAVDQKAASVEPAPPIAPADDSLVRYYAVDWSTSPIAATPGKPGHTLLFTSDPALADLWRAEGERVTLVTSGSRFAQHGPDRYSIDPANAGDYVLLLETLRQSELPARSAFFWNDETLDAFTGGPAALFHFVNAWARIGNQTRPGRIVVGWHGDNLVYESLAGFAKSIGPVLPNAAFSTVQFDTPESNGAALVLAEIRNQRPDPEVRYSEGERLAKRAGVEPRPTGAAPFRTEGVYLIAGGAGGIGLAVARHLASKYHARVVLIGRSAFDTSKRKLLDEICRLGGDGLYVQADVADRQAMQNAVSLTHARFGPIQGIIHSAGLAQRKPVVQKTLEEFTGVLKPRFEGALVLDAVTAGDPLEFFALFSSTSVLLGDMGQCDYAVANRYLDGFAHWRSLQVRAGKSVSINWPLWREGGLHLESGEEAALRYSGMTYLETDSALRAFEAILTGSHPQMMVVATPDPTRLERFLAPAEIVPRADAEIEVRAESPKAAQTTAPAASIPELEEMLRGLISRLLDLSPEHIQPDENLMNLGFDSLMLNSFVRELNDRFPWLDLTPAALFEHQDVRSIAAYIHERQPASEQATNSGEGPKTSARCLVPLQRTGTQTPSFWIPGSFGLAQTFSALPHGLGPDYPLYSFQARGIDGFEMPFLSVEEMADHYLEQILQVRPEGPYVLGGYSWGGLVAAELARRLAGLGRTPPRLILFDTYPPAPEIYAMTQHPANQLRIRFILANFLAGHGENGEVITERDLAGVPARLRDAHLVRLIRERGRNPMPEAEIFRLFRGAVEVNDYASEAYTLHRLRDVPASEVLYFRSLQGGDEYVGNFDYVSPWKQVLGEKMRVIQTGFTHAYLVSTAALIEIGPHIKAAIAEAVPRF